MMTGLKLDRDEVRRDLSALDRWEAQVSATYAELADRVGVFTPEGDGSSPAELEDFERSVRDDRDWSEGYRRGLNDAALPRHEARQGPGATPDPKDGWTASPTRQAGYAAGLADKHPGSGQSLSQIFEATDRVLVVKGDSFDPRHRGANRVLADVRDPAILSSLADALAIKPPSDVAMMTTGNPSLAFLAGRRLLALVQCLPGHLRCETLWSSDVRLVRPSDLEHWLDRATASDEETL